MFVWLCGGGRELPQLFIMRSKSNPHLIPGDISPYQWVPVKAHTPTLSPPATSICSICNGCVRLCRSIFFILINCMGAIYFPLRQWRWLGVRETLVRADKLLLTRRPAGGTRFTKKTMSTRSDTCTKTHAHIHTHLNTLYLWGHQLHYYNRLEPLHLRKILVVFKLGLIQKTSNFSSEILKMETCQSRR